MDSVGLRRHPARHRPRIMLGVNRHIILVFAWTCRLQLARADQPVVDSAYRISAWCHPQKHATLRQGIDQRVVFQMDFVAWPFVALGAKGD